jgi:hypothetical protein
MAKPDAVEKQHESEVKHVAEAVFSSEKREDVWAIIIAVVIFLFCVVFPAQVHHFFTSALFLF